MTYLANYPSLWSEVASNDDRNSLFYKSPRHREGDLELVTRRTFNGVSALFKFHELPEAAYLRSLEDPAFLGVLADYGFETGFLQEKVSEFKGYSTARKISNNILSRLQIGPLFLGIMGVYSWKMVHPTVAEIKKANAELKRTYREALNGAENSDDLERSKLAYLENFRPSPPMIISCWERKLLSGRPYGELGVIGFATTEANHLFRTYLQVLDQLRA